MYGCQCPKRLWLHKYRPDVRDEMDEEQEAVFQRGTDVGKLSEQLFPGGVDARPDAAFQYYVITQAGLELADFTIVYQNTKYVRYGDLNVQALFSAESVLDRLLPMQEFIHEKGIALKTVVANKKEMHLHIPLNRCGPIATVYFTANMQCQLVYEDGI
ncbi:MAG: hypothetical protein RI983_636 [Bacteroidota bacterium]|jgi:hypothetical protein